MFSSYGNVCGVWGLGCVCVLRECVCRRYYNWNLHTFISYYILQIILCLVYFSFPLMSLLLSANIKNDQNYLSSFKLKNHLIQLNRTYKIDCIIRHGVLLKDTPKTIQGHFSIAGKKFIMLYSFFCIYLYFLIYFIVFHNKTYIFVFANCASYFLFALI